ncbi:hypothetical protein NIE88_18620 [Sporolactobacillus shoreicorticis]|uniref:Lipoprotein n=1 Tax=Sporolactobacillus shoreicorticis TaxID=1923877 RepID=A0ABW5S675_9BACL|nr:hypothetical protein [Sporolactobacillus shoreicorticis]MCO7127763.1 hypothetical protein [Sporolactobacillus shoreicorticis]
MGAFIGLLGTALIVISFIYLLIISIKNLHNRNKINGANKKRLLSATGILVLGIIFFSIGMATTPTGSADNDAGSNSESSNHSIDAESNDSSSNDISSDSSVSLSSSDSSSDSSSADSSASKQVANVQKPQNGIDLSETKTTKPVATHKKQTQDKKVCPIAGLGDSKKTFGRDYGKGKGDSEMMRYKNDYILPMFSGNAAFNILLQFESTDRPTRSKNEAIQAYQEMIPLDSTKIKESSDSENNRDIIEYHSDKLAKAVDKELFSGSKQGTFIAILHENDQGKYFSVVLGTGNNP